MGSVYVKPSIQAHPSLIPPSTLSCLRQMYMTLTTCTTVGQWEEKKFPLCTETQLSSASLSENNQLDLTHLMKSE